MKHLATAFVALSALCLAPEASALSPSSVKKFPKRPAAAAQKDAPSRKTPARAGSRLRALPDALSHKAPQRRLTAGGSDVQGFLIYNSEEIPPVGLYSLTPNGASLLWADEAYIDEGFVFDAGWVRDGKLCGYQSIVFWGVVTDLRYAEYDPATGKLLSEEEMKPDGLYFSTAAYDYASDTIYGYGFDADENSYFLSAPANSPEDISVVKEITSDEDFCCSLTYSNTDGSLYGVDYAGNFCKVSSSGARTVLFDTGVPNAGYITGLCYSPSEGVFYWNVNIDDEAQTSYLATINPRTKTVSKVVDYSLGEEYSFFICKDDAPAADVPARPDIISCLFQKGALDGSVTFRLPSALADNTPLSGYLDWTLSVDGETAKTGSAAAGSEVKTDLSGISQGMHTFSVAASKDGKKGPAANISAWIGMDVPETVEDLDITVSRDMLYGDLSWTAPTEGFHDGYIDPAGLKYEVFLITEDADGNVEFESKGTTTKTSFRFDAAAYSVPHQFEIGVLASNSEGDCGYIESESATLGQPFTAPLSFSFSSSDYFDPWILADTGESLAEWYFDSLSSSLPSLFPDDDSVALIGESSGILSSYDMLYLPPFSTKASDTGLRLNLYTGTDIPDMTLYVYSPYVGEEPVAIGSVSPKGNGFSWVDFSIPDAYQGLDWVNVIVECEFPEDEATYFALKGVELTSGSGIGAITGADSSEAEYFNLQGIRIANPENGIFIRRQGGKSIKIKR